MTFDGFLGGVFVACVVIGVWIFAGVITGRIPLFL